MYQLGLPCIDNKSPIDQIHIEYIFCLNFSNRPFICRMFRDTLKNVSVQVFFFVMLRFSCFSHPWSNVYMLSMEHVCVRVRRCGWRYFLFLLIYTYMHTTHLFSLFLFSFSCPFFHPLALFFLVLLFLGYWVFGAQFCDTWVAFDVMCSTASILNLCAISLDRYIHIKDPLR